MQRALTALTLICGCIAAISVAYYSGLYLPRFHDAELAEQRRKTDIENGQKCHEDGVKFYSDYRKLPESAAVSTFLTWYNPSDPDTHFSRKRNTCLVETGFDQIVGGKPQREVMVVDVYNNRRTLIIGEYTFDYRQRPAHLLVLVPGHLDLEEYYAQKNKLFSE